MWLNTLSFPKAILFSFLIGTLLSIYVYFKEDSLKQYEISLPFTQKIQLYVNRIIHYSISFFSRAYPFLVTVSLLNDGIYLFLAFLLIVQFSISECIISIHEKQLLYPEYRAGDEPYHQPFWILLNSSDRFYYSMQFIGVFALIFVVCRFIYNLFKSC